MAAVNARKKRSVSESYNSFANRDKFCIPLGQESAQIIET